jgi:hypothetical protein
MDQNFRRTLLVAVRNSKLTAFQKATVRLRSISPVFQQEVAAVICEYVVEEFNKGTFNVSISSDVVIQCQNFLNDVDVLVDWDKLLEFIERILPIILKLIDLFA